MFKSFRIQRKLLLKEDIMRSYTFIAALLALFFVGCQKPTINIEENTLSYTNNEWDVSVNRPVFSAQNAALEKGCKE